MTWLLDLVELQASPSREQRARELAELARGVVDLLGLLVARREEGLEEPKRALRRGADERADLRLERLERRDEREGPIPGDYVTRLDAMSEAAVASFHPGDCRVRGLWDLDPDSGRHVRIRRACVFPSTTEWTPALGSCCAELDGLCTPDPGLWNGPTWERLRFRVGERTAHSYRFYSSGDHGNALFIAEAAADFDCDGTHSVYDRVGLFDEARGVVDVESIAGLEPVGTSE